MYQAKIVLDNIAPNGARLTTVEVTFPRIILAEWNTHRVFSRNTASSRAIPVKKLVEAIKKDPFVPERFPKNQAGMQNSVWLTGYKEKTARTTWLFARSISLKIAQLLDKVGVHKQIGNRLLEPFMWVTSITSATEWNNFFSLRVNTEIADKVSTWEEYKEENDKDPFPAQIEIQHVTFLLRKAFNESVPNKVGEGGWHLPYLTEQDWNWAGANHDSYEQGLETMKKVSMGRCARVSYLNHGENNTPEKDLDICNRLIEARHMSPTEHVAQSLATKRFSGNFKGWKQERKNIVGESGG